MPVAFATVSLAAATTFFTTSTASSTASAGPLFRPCFAAICVPHLLEKTLSVAYVATEARKMEIPGDNSSLSALTACG
jgi:hypothetical protein